MVESGDRPIICQSTLHYAKKKSACDCYPMPCWLVDPQITFVGFIPTKLFFKQNIVRPIEKERITGERKELLAIRVS